VAESAIFRRQESQRTNAFMTVQEAAHALGIGEALAYRMANEFLQSGGSSGIPCVRLGRRLLVSRRGLERLAAVGAQAG
jgi:hypothetical protein